MVAPVAAEYLPEGHREQAGLPGVSEYVPEEQLRHVAAVLDPVAAEYLPGTQGSHTNGLVPTVTNPELHTQDVSAVLDAGDVLKMGQLMQLASPPGEYLPAMQSEHAMFPDTSLYLPAAHRTHIFR